MKVGMTRKEVRQSINSGHDSLLFTAGNGRNAYCIFISDHKEDLENVCHE